MLEKRMADGHVLFKSMEKEMLIVKGITNHMTKEINLGILETTKDFRTGTDPIESDKDRCENDEELEQAAMLFAQIIYDNWTAQMGSEGETYQTIGEAA
jgi:hypothetical protein